MSGYVLYREPSSGGGWVVVALVALWSTRPTPALSPGTTPAPSSAHPLGQPCDSGVTLTSLSIGDISVQAFNAVCLYFERWAIRFVSSVEGGEERTNLHLQGIVAFGLLKSFSDDIKIKLWAAMVQTLPSARAA